MTADLTPARKPDNLPEYPLWMLVKDGKTVEARVRQGPFGLELRIYDSGAFLRTEVLRDGLSIRELAAETQREWLERGWSDR